MENNEFGMEAIINNGLGFSDSLFNTKKTNFDGDFDSMSLEIASTENLVNFAETYNQLDAYNADQKIRMLKKLHVHTRNVPGKYGKSVENFIIEQSLEEAATKEAAGEKSGANPAKLPNGTISKQRDGFLSKVWETLVRIFNGIKKWIIEKIRWIKSKIINRNKSIANEIKQIPSNEIGSLWDGIDDSLPQSANKSEEGAIHLNEKTVSTMIQRVKDLQKIGKILNAQATTVANKGNQLGKSGNADGLLKSVNNAHTVLKIFAPDFEIPTIKGSSKNDIAAFNKLYKNCLANLKWEHDPVMYSKIFTGEECTPLKNKKASECIKIIFGTTNPTNVANIIDSIGNKLSVIEDELHVLDESINDSDKQFKSYLQNKDRKIMNNDGTFNARTEEGNSDDDVVYQWATTTTLTFKLTIAVTSIAMKVINNMNTHLKSAADAIYTAATNRNKMFGGKKSSQDTLEANGFDKHGFDNKPMNDKYANKIEKAKSNYANKVENQKAKAEAKAAKQQFKKDIKAAKMGK